MQCIVSSVSDGNVKECAKRATWLANDELIMDAFGQKLELLLVGFRDEELGQTSL